MAISDWTLMWAEIPPVAVAWLLTLAIHSTLLLGLAWLVARCVRSHCLKDVLWKTVLIGGMLTTTLQAAFEVKPLTGRFDLLASPAPMLLSQDRGEIASETIPQVHISSDVDSDRRSEPTEPVLSEGTLAPSAGRQAAEQLARAAMSLCDRLGSVFQNGADWLFGLWLVGATAASLRFGLARRRLYSSLNHRRDVSDNALTTMLAQLCRAGSVRRPVRLTCSPHISSPMTLSATEICLPQRALTEFSSEQQESLLAHELAHVVRRDPVWLLVCGVLESLFFFQPLFRLARRQVQECAEYLCDDWTARYTGCGLALAKCLVQVAVWPHMHTQAVAVPGMARSVSNLERRVQRLLDDSQVGQVESLRWWWAAIIVGTLVLIWYTAPVVAVKAGITWPGDGAWEVVYQNQVDAGYSITTAGFLDDAFGVAVGCWGETLYTVSAGMDWNWSANSLECGYGLDVVDERVVWLCGDQGIRVSTDGAQTWQVVTDSPGDADLCRFLSFLDARTGWAATPHQLGMTVDGGATWTDVTLPENVQEIAAIALETAVDGYVLDKGGNLFVTQDGGQTWVSRSLGPMIRGDKRLFDLASPTAAIRFLDANHGVVILSLIGGGERETLAMYTSDGGRTWEEQSLVEQFGAVHLTRDGRFLTLVDFVESDITVFHYQEH